MIEYLQQVTAYIDTRDRRTAGGALVLNASLSGFAENVDKRWESLLVRDQRADARVASLANGHDELRAMLGVLQQASLSLKREFERIQGAASLPPAQNAPPVRHEQPATTTFRRWTAISTSASRISFAAQEKPSPTACRAICRSSLARATCSTSVAGAASFSIYWPVPACGHADSTSTTRWWSLPRARTRRRRGGRRQLPRVAARRVARRAVRRPGGRASAAGLPAALPRARVPQDYGPAPRSFSKR